MGKLKDKVVVITGASSGIGACTAELLAQEGAITVLVARRENKLAEVCDRIIKNSGRAYPIVADITIPEECKRIFRQTYEQFGRIDVLINNAGIHDFHAPAIRTSDELWDNVVNINQKAAFMCCREVLKYMIKANSGVIVNVSSILGVYGYGGLAGSASKYALIGITRNIGIQYAGTGIRCNAICPGPTVFGEGEVHDDSQFDKEFMEIVNRHMDMTVPPSQAIEQAKVILFLCSDDSKCINGQFIVTDRGKCL